MATKGKTGATVKKVNLVSGLKLSEIGGKRDFWLVFGVKTGFHGLVCSD